MVLYELFEMVCLFILVVQGFAVCWWEYGVWKLHHDRHEERTKWRVAKQKAKLKNLEIGAVASGITTAGPTTCTTNSSESKVENAPVVDDLPN